MKKFKLLLPLFLLGAVATAQITINNADMPVAGDTIRMSNGVAFPGMDATLTGANHTWDFSQLTSATQTIDTFLDVSGTDPIYALYFINFGLNKNRSNLAKRGTSFSVLTTTVNEVFNFYYNSNKRYEQTGFGAAINGITIPTPYAPHDTIYHFPMTFGQADSSHSGYTFKLPSIFYYHNSTYRHNEVDGWGSLTTPYGTFDALRVKTIITGHDSIYLDTLLKIGYGFDTFEQIQYKWLGKGKGEPLLQINTIAGIPTQIIYRDSVRGRFNNIGISEHEALSVEPVIFPNPSGNVQSIIYSLREPADVKLEVYDVLGNKILTLADERQAADKHFYSLNVGEEKFASGVYVLHLCVNGKSYQQKLQVAK